MEPRFKKNALHLLVAGANIDSSRLTTILEQSPTSDAMLFAHFVPATLPPSIADYWNPKWSTAQARRFSGRGIVAAPAVPIRGLLTVL